MSNAHVGRSWRGHEIEDQCPCVKAACGLAVLRDLSGAECDQHNGYQTMRQGHLAEDCPANKA